MSRARFRTRYPFRPIASASIRAAVAMSSAAPVKLTGGEGGEPVRFGVVTVSDRASEGIYDDLSGPAIIQFFHEAIKNRWVGKGQARRGRQKMTRGKRRVGRARGKASGGRSIGAAAIKRRTAIRRSPRWWMRCWVFGGSGCGLESRKGSVAVRAAAQSVTRQRVRERYGNASREAARERASR